MFSFGGQSLNSEHVRQNINYSRDFFRQGSMATNSSHASALDVVTSQYFYLQWKQTINGELRVGTLDLNYMYKHAIYSRKFILIIVSWVTGRYLQFF